MDAVFLEFLNRSISAGWLILAVVLLRLLFKNAPKALPCALWALVGIRLVCPISLESMLSLVPSAETVPLETLYSATPTIHTGIAVVNEAVNPFLSETFAPAELASANPLQIITYAASIVWLIGIAAMLLYALVSALRLHRRVAAAMKWKDGLWLCDEIASPFILGIFRPRIYLPSDLDEQQLRLIVAHETVHLKRRDHWRKPLGYLLLAVYWFHPLVWLAYALFCRDLELACDAHVIRKMGIDNKKTYSETLLACSAPRQMLSACPLSFGEGDVKRRIQSVLHYKKPSFWIVLTSVAVCVAVAVCFLTNPKPRLQETTDLSDIATMNIGAEMPRLLYGDEQKVILEGTCGLVVYDIERGKIDSRVPASELTKLDIYSLCTCVSADGNTVFFANFDGQFCYEYDLQTKALHDDRQDSPPELYRVRDSGDYQQYFFPLFLSSEYPWLIGDTIIDFDTGFYYLRATSDWRMGNLQLVTQYYDGSSNVVDIFPC